MPSGSKPSGMPGAPTDGKGKGRSQWLWVIIVLLIIAGAVYFLGKGDAKAPAPEPEGENSALQSENERKTGPSLSWEFAPAGGDPETGAPMTKVMLVVDGESRDLGVHDGHCMIVDGAGAWTLSEGEITGVICYFAGAGTELGVFYDAGTYVVKQGVVEEGTAEEPGIRGEYEALFTI
jgi:hypothetical protein